MARPTYYLEFELAYDTWTNLISDWRASMPLIIERGCEAGERVAQIGTMALALHNPDGRYTVGHANVRAGFEVGIGVRLRVTAGAITETLFYGRLASVEHQTSAGAPVTRIVVEDEMAAAARVTVGAFPLMIDAAPEAVISALVDRAFTPPGLFGYWRLGHGSAGLLGSGTRLPDGDTGKALAEGQSEFAWVGDTWRGSVSVAQAIREVCESEGGGFYIAADGTPTFEDRHARPKRIAASATISGGLGGVVVDRSAARIANEISVTVHPREAGESIEVLWQADSAIRLAGSEPREVVCRYRDPDQRVAWIGASSVLVPERGIDFTVTDRLDGSGADYSDQVEIELNAGAASAKVRIRRDQGVPPVVYVHDLRLRGTALRAFLPVSAAQSDGASVLAYGHRPLAVELPLQVDTGAGQDTATALLATRKSAHAWLTVQIDTAAGASLLEHAISRDIGDRVVISEAGLALDAAAGFIDGVRHEIQRGGPKEHRGDYHRVIWRMSPAGLEAYFVLDGDGLGELGSAVLGY